MINRHIESEIIDNAKKYKVIALIGSRCCGKTELIKKLFPENHFFKIDNPFFTVEQKIEKIKFACENRTENGLVLSVNSSELKLIEELKKLENENLIKIINIQNLSYREISKDSFNEEFLPIYDFINKREKTAKEPEIFWSIIYRGCSIDVNDFEMERSQNEIKNNIEDFYEKFLKDFIFQDVMKITSIQDILAFRAFLEAFAEQSGKMLNYSKIAHAIKKDVMTVKHWVKILVQAKLVFLVNPYNEKSITRAIKSTPKVYFFDTGLACYLCKCFSPQELAFSELSSQMFENFVVSEIAKSYINKQVDFENLFSYYRAKDKKIVLHNDKKVIIEDTIDLIIEKDNVLYPIKITQNFSAIKEISNVFEILDGIENKNRGSSAIICNCYQAEEISKDIFQIPAWFI